MNAMMRSLIAATAILISASSGDAASLTATPATIQAMFDTAHGGDTITLAAGDYAPLRITGHKWEPALTIEAGAARMSNVAFNAVSGLVWHGGNFNGNDTIHTGWSAGTSDHITVEGLTLVHYTRNGIVFGQVSDARVANNLITDSGSDGIDLAESRRIVVDHNECRDTKPTDGAHPDCIQLWSRPATPPVADITITNNKVSGDTQGITMFNHIRNGVDDGGFDRIRIEDNTLAVKQWHGIAVYNCRKCIIRRNRVDTQDNGRIKAWIRFIASDVEACGNVASAYSKSEDKRCKDKDRD